MICMGHKFPTDIYHTSTRALSVCSCDMYKKSVVFTIGSWITPTICNRLVCSCYWQLTLQQVFVLVIALLGLSFNPGQVECHHARHVPCARRYYIVWMDGICMFRAIYIHICMHFLPSAAVCDPLPNAVFIIILKEIWYTPSDGSAHVCPTNPFCIHLLLLVPRTQRLSRMWHTAHIIP